MARTKFTVVLLIYFSLATDHWPLTGHWATVEAGTVERHEALLVAYLSGTPYELGHQHGELLRDQVRASVRQVLGYFRRYLQIPWVRAWLVNWWLDDAWRQATRFISPDDTEELRGLADGAGVSLQDLYRLHAIPDRTYACSSFAAWGSATADGRLIHVRNLDWNIQAGIQRFAVLFVVQPAGKHAFVSAGWAGFIGVLTGVNDAQLSVGQIGAETTDASFQGEPMTFLMRRVLEEAGTLEEAAAVVRNSTRTVGVNYVFADAKAGRAIILETTRHHLQVFEADDAREHSIPYAQPMPNAVFRADTAMDPAIRDRQLASQGDPHRPGLEPPAGSAYEVRYLGQARGLRAHVGRLTPTIAMQIAQAVAPPSNIQSVVVAWPDLWVANADHTTPAAYTTYHHVDLSRLFGERSRDEGRPPPRAGGSKKTVR